MHTKTNNLEYPVQCEMCDKSFENEIERKEHLRTHSYKKSTYKCEDCDYWCELSNNGSSYRKVSQ